MKNHLMRPSAALFPLVLIAAQWITGELYPEVVLFLYLILQMFSLCAVDCFRNAAAREPGPRKVDKRFWGSLPMLFIASAAMLSLIVHTAGNFSAGYIFFPLLPLLISIEHLFEERLFTLNRRSDGNILSLIANGLLFAGLMLDGSNGVPKPFEMFYTLAASGLGALIAVLTSLVIAPPKGFSLIPRNLGFAPKAILQTLLFPAAYLGLISLISKGFDDYVVGFFAGYTLWRLSRTVCRRSFDESRPLNLLLIAVCAVMTGAAGFVPALFEPAICCLLALVCAMIVFLHIGWRNLTGALLLIAAAACIYLKIEYANYIAAACSLIAVIINLKNAFLRRK